MSRTRHPSIERHSEPRNRGALSSHPAPSPYLLHRNKFRTYDHTTAAEALGHTFVFAACEAVRAQKTEAGVLLRTWLDNYVVRLGELLDALQAFPRTGGTPPRDPSRFEPEDWMRFESWLHARIEALPLARRTRSKAVGTINKLLAILHRAVVIPVRIELASDRTRKIARVGQSRFTQRGWMHKPPPTRSDSPFAFFVEAHGREYDYTPFRDLGRLFVLNTTAVLRTQFQARSANLAKDTHETWTGVLRHLQSRRDGGASPALFRTLSSDGFATIAAEEWEEALYGWRQELATQVDLGQRKPVTHHRTISKLNEAWALFADAGLVAAVRVKGFKNAKSRFLRESRATLAQLTVRDVTADAAVHSATERIATLLDIQDQPEARQYLRSLSQELAPDIVRGLPVEAVIDEIHALNARRLATLRQCAERDFLKWYEHWRKGQAAYLDCALDGRELAALFEDPTLTVSETRRRSASLLFEGDEHVRLGRALRYIEARYDGIVSGIHGRIHHLSRSFGGRPTLTAYLHPHEDATLALWVMMMVDTGANCEVTRTCPWNCVEPSRRPGSHRLVLGPKRRSDGATIIDELPENTTDGSLSLVRAIGMYRTMATRHRALAAPDASESLFLHEGKGRTKTLTEWTARNWFTAFLARHAELERLDARPSMIRPSVLMDVQHRSGNHVDAAQALADHLRPTTTLQHYTGRTPTKLRYALAMREFQNRFQSVVIVSIDGAAARLGLTEAQFATLFSEAARTGLGVACLDPMAGIQPGTRQGEPCTRFDRCCDCRMRWVVATVDNVADLMLFKEHLESVRTTGSGTDSERWEERWAPWLAFAEVVLHKLREGECAGIHDAALAEATARRANYVRLPLS